MILRLIAQACPFHRILVICSLCETKCYAYTHTECDIRTLGFHRWLTFRKWYLSIKKRQFLYRYHFSHVVICFSVCALNLKQFLRDFNPFFLEFSHTDLTKITIGRYPDFYKSKKRLTVIKMYWQKHENT